MDQAAYNKILSYMKNDKPRRAKLPWSSTSEQYNLKIANSSLSFEEKDLHIKR